MATIRHHLLLLQMDPAQPARDHGGPPHGETFFGKRACLVGHDCLTSGRTPRSGSRPEDKQQPARSRSWLDNRWLEC